MANYLIALGIVLLGIAQVAWANLLIVWGIVVPLSVIGVWGASYKSEFKDTAIYAFLSGLVIDILSSDTFGLHIFALLLSIGGMEFVSRRFNRTSLVTRIMALIAGLVIYEAIIIGANNILGI